MLMIISFLEEKAWRSGYEFPAPIREQDVSLLHIC